MTRRLIQTVDILNILIAGARRPWPDRIDIYVPPQPPMTRASGYPFSGGLLPVEHVEYTLRHSYRTRASAVANSLALGRTADAAIAVSRYRRATGSLPDSLKELVPAYLAAIPIDPYSGHEVRYSRSPNGYVVHSLGANKRDDGGAGVTDPPWSMGIARQPNTLPDIGVAVRISPKGR
jgi:hypothetical protein